MRLPTPSAFTGLMVLALLSIDSSANPMGTTENFYDRPGGDYFQFEAGHASTCSTSCATDAQCKAYTYVTSTGICWKKNTVPKRKHNNCCISGVKIMGAQEINFDRPGGDIKPGFPTVTSSQCENHCRANINCRSYTWVKPGVQAQSGLCWLKNKRPGKVANSCCISGKRLRDPLRVRSASGNLRQRP